MNKLFKYTWAALAISALAACSEDVTPEATNPTVEVDPNEGKELIVFSQEGGSSTRAALTRAGFTADTKVVIRIKAQNGTASSYRYTEAVATAGSQTTSDDDCNVTGYLGTGVRHSHLAYTPTYYRYWDDAFGRTSKLEVYAVAVKNKDNDALLASNILTQTGEGISAVNANTNPNWYTIASPASESFKINWSVSADQTDETRLNEDLVYSNNISDAETDATMKGRYHQSWDGSGWAKSMLNGRMAWQSKNPLDDAVTTGKFDQGHLIFKEALSWIEINFKEGAGFNNSSASDFVWTNTGGKNQAIKLVGFPTSGKLDISTGSWSESVTNVDITQMDETTGTPSAQTTRQLHAYVLPGTTLYGNSNNVVQFEIDNAKYYITGNQIAEAIRKYYREDDPATTEVDEAGPGAGDAHAATNRSFTTTEAGKHYIINLTVAKKGIDNITAAVLDWETVNSSDATAKNTYCTFDFEDRETKLTSGQASQFDIYRAAKGAGDYITGTTEANWDWATGYTLYDSPYTANKATKTWSTDHWTTDWYWENNKTYYHFRAAGTGTTASGDAGVTADAVNGDYFSIASGIIGGGTYKDYVWGAPFTFVDNSYKMNYTTTNGFSLKKDGTTKQISKAIGATDSQIKMLLFHMTSQITVDVKTTTDNSEVVLWQNGGATDADKTKVEILNYQPNGEVLMGTGAVSANGDRTDGTMSYGSYTAKSGAGTNENPYVAAKVTNYQYGIVPQDLSNVKLRITTPDGNKYEAVLNTCKATVTTKNLLNPYTKSGDLYIIDAWYPHYQYNYTITIKKTGIENITAAVLPWEEVHGDLGTIDLEN